MKSLSERRAQRVYLAGVNAGEIDDEVALTGASDGVPVNTAVDFSKRKGTPKPETDGDNNPVIATESKTLPTMNKAELTDYIKARNGDVSDATKDILLERAKALPADVPVQEPAGGGAGGNGGGAPAGGWGNQ